MQQLMLERNQLPENLDMPGDDRSQPDPVTNLTRSAPTHERPDRGGQDVCAVPSGTSAAEGGGFEPPRDVTPNTDSSRAP
jgi:hypothetical protein